MEESPVDESQSNGGIPSPLAQDIATVRKESTAAIAVLSFDGDYGDSGVGTLVSLCFGPQISFKVLSKRFENLIGKETAAPGERESRITRLRARGAGAWRARRLRLAALPAEISPTREGLKGNWTPARLGKSQGGFPTARRVQRAAQGPTRGLLTAPKGSSGIPLSSETRVLINSPRKIK